METLGDGAGDLLEAFDVEADHGGEALPDAPAQSGRSEKGATRRNTTFHF